MVYDRSIQNITTFSLGIQISRERLSKWPQHWVLLCVVIRNTALISGVMMMELFSSIAGFHFQTK